MKAELQKCTVKSSNLKAQVGHHRSLWEERERRGREEARRRQETERREKQERERQAKREREERSKREEAEASRAAREAKAQEEKVSKPFYVCVS